MKKVDEFITSNTYDFKDTFSSRPAGESLTKPDMVLSIAEIFSRYSRGLPVPDGIPINVNEDISGFSKMDKFDKIEYARTLKERQTVLEAELKSAEAKRAKEISDAAFNKAVDDKINSINALKGGISDDN